MRSPPLSSLFPPLFPPSPYRLSVIAITSEQFVLQKVIKEGWYVVVECLHHMLLPMLKWEYDGVQATPTANFPLHHFTSRQCTALELMMDLLKARWMLCMLHTCCNLW